MDNLVFIEILFFSILFLYFFMILSGIIRNKIWEKKEEKYKCFIIFKKISSMFVGSGMKYVECSVGIRFSFSFFFRGLFCILYIIFD